jgi:hypothetical protein
VKCFALTKKFLHYKIFPKYPDIASEMKAESLLRYRRSLKVPITAHMEREYKNMNRKSLNRVFEFKEKKQTEKPHFTGGHYMPNKVGDF